MPVRLAWLFPVVMLVLAGCIAATDRPRSGVSVPLGAEAQAAADTSGSSLRLLMPVDGLRTVDIGNNFGAPRGGRWHEGLDLFAARGTPVRPAASGRLWLVGETPLGGLSVTVDGDDGLRYFYTHLDAVPAGLAAGQRVNVSDVIGFVGNSGNAAGGPTHLHFAVYAPTSDGRGWMAFDPTPHLVDRAVAGR